jgi:hypothetical protein
MFDYLFVGFEVITAVSMKSMVLWVVTTCGSERQPHVSEELVASILRVKVNRTNKQQRE